MTIDIAFTLNGASQQLTVRPHELLIHVIRDRLGLTGTKLSCDVQVCGSCTVLVNGLPVSSCTTLAVEIDHDDVLTIEGVGDNGQLDPIQQAFVECGALQCGFCTPGMILAMRALLAVRPAATEEETRHFLRGNLCRCTGYWKILDAVKTLRDNSTTPWRAD